MASFRSNCDRWLANDSLRAIVSKCEAATIEPTVVVISTAVSTPPMIAITGLRLAHRHYLSAAFTWRARIGSSSRK
jgi:hypothetical protein